jgi:CBS domain-containing protein
MLRKIAEVLPSPEIVALPHAATVVEAARLMKSRHCGAVLVMKDQVLFGIFTERDVVNRVVAERRDPETTELESVMTPSPTCIESDQLAVTALQTMEDGGFRHLPVTRNGNLVGVVSRRDFLGEERVELERERHLWERIA